MQAWPVCRGRRLAGAEKVICAQHRQFDGYLSKALDRIEPVGEEDFVKERWIMPKRQSQKAVATPKAGRPKCKNYGISKD